MSGSRGYGTLLQAASTPTVVSGPLCWPAEIEGNGYYEAVAGQAATRVASQVGGDLIRKIQPLEEPHTLAPRKVGKQLKALYS